MQVVNLTKRQFAKLKPIELAKNILNNEADMYYLYGKMDWEKRKYVLKKLYHDEGEIFGNKLYTINALLDKKDEINMEELVMPEALGVVSQEIVGPIMPYVPSINLSYILASSDLEFSLKQKIAYLQEVGAILEKMHKVREYTSVKDFYLNDIHEGNFILNTKTNHINAVDLDSAKIGHNLPFASYYLGPFGLHTYSSKYQETDSDHFIGAFYEVSENTDIYCYIMIILKFLYQYDVVNMNTDEFYDYLEYMSDLGISKELIDIFSTILINKDNINPYEYLEELIPYYNKLNRNTFVRVRSK